MAVYDTPRANVAGLSLSGRVSFTLTHLAADLVSWNRTRQTKTALSKLSNRELDDIGMSRADLANM